MDGYNDCRLVGRAKKIEPIKQTQKGSIKEFYLKVKRYNSNENRKTEYDYFKIKSLNKLAEYLEIVLKEDSKVMCLGEMQIDKIKEKYYPYLVLVRIIHIDKL